MLLCTRHHTVVYENATAAAGLSATEKDSKNHSEQRSSLNVHFAAATQGNSMSVMEFILVAHAIIVGLAIAEILRGLADLVRADGTRVSYRLLLMSGWALLLLLQVWWAIWQVGARPGWTFPEFLIFLMPVAILYVFARLCFPEKVAESNLQAYYLRIAPVLFLLVAATYATFAFLLSPFVFRAFVPWLFASQLVLVVLAIVAGRYQARAFHLFVLAAMIAQVGWRGLATVVGN